jgi:hypothetical protein
MGAKTTNYAQSLLELIFNTTTIANIAENASSSPFTTLYISLHTSSPGTSGTQNTNEAAYTSYARQAVTRTSGGWTITSNSVSPNANITFPTASGGSETETYFGVGASVAGAGPLYYFGTLSPSIAVTSGTQPVLTNSTSITES